MENRVLNAYGLPDADQSAGSISIDGHHHVDYSGADDYFPHRLSCEKQRRFN